LCLDSAGARLLPLGQAPWHSTAAVLAALPDGQGSLVAGPAAAARSPLAGLLADGLHAVGPGGVALPLAAKNLFALAATGGTDPLPADPAGLAAARAAMERLIAAAPALSGPCGFGRYGTAALLDLTAGRRMLPTKNFRQTAFAAAPRLSAPLLVAALRPLAAGCPGCPVPCRHIAPDGTVLPGHDALSHMTALLGLDDPALAVAACAACREAGLDAPGAAVLLAGRAEAAERDIAPEALLPALAGLVREGAGLGRPALAVTVKGVALPAFDPRGAYGLALSLAVGPSGPQAWDGLCLAHELLRKPVATDRFSFAGKARAVCLGENAVAAAASLGGCPYMSLAVTLEEWGLALAAVTGRAVCAADLARLGGAVVGCERGVNARAGLDAAADDLPGRFFTEPGSSGQGVAVPPLPRAEFLAARAAYYHLRGLGADARPVAARAVPPGVVMADLTPARATARSTDLAAALARRFAGKLAAAGLTAPDGAVAACLDDALVFSRPSPHEALLAGLVENLGVGCVLLAPPAEPHRTILEFLAGREAPAIRPRDCETRTFFHDIPVIPGPDLAAATAALSRRKGAYLPGVGILAHGALSPEQAFVTVSSVAFAGFVKFFADALAARRAGTMDPAFCQAFAAARRHLPPPPTVLPQLARGPFGDRETLLAAMAQAGRATVELGLVDSVFGNISYTLEGVLAISQTGAALDELPGAIDLVPLDGSSCAGLTASSELAAHAALAGLDGRAAILHGHPRFAVIMSMDCEESATCPGRDTCHVDCRRERFVGDTPIVPGEVGCGPHGLVHTMPPALAADGGRPGVIVCGHGVFTMGAEDFGPALAALCAIETFCRDRYFAAFGPSYD
jgi:aldehyde:ferredoxin oxidoreductase/ribulose-5-phosphate 4-epimerase/fuculose-1-phosphate aldolase